MNHLFSLIRDNFLNIAFLFALSMLLPAVATGAEQQSSVPSCPGTNEMKLELAAREERLLKLQAGLSDFVAGKAIADMPLTALFKIDVTNEDAVAQRLESLQREAALTVTEISASDVFLSCALATKGLDTAAEALITLQRSISELRLQFLNLAPEKRAAILRPIIEATAQAATVKQLQEEHSSALEEQQQAAKSLARVEQQELVAQADSAGDLVSERAQLERIKTELTALQVKWVADLEKEAAFYQETSEKLAEIGKFLLQPDPNLTPKTEYERALAIWRRLVDKTPKVVTGRKALNLPPLPAYPEKILVEIGDTAGTQQFNKAYAEAQAFRDSLLEKIGVRLQESVDRHYRVLLQSGEIRSQLLNQLLDANDYSPLALSIDLLQDIRREFAIVPYRWSATFYLRMLDVRRDLGLGWEGLKETTTNLTILILFLLIPWILWVWIQRLTQHLNQLRIELVRQSKSLPLASHLALVIQKILPYAPWLVMLLALSIAQWLLQMTVFAELSLLLPYIRYYIYYRLFRQLMQCDFIWVNRQIRLAKLWNLRRQADVAARALGLSAFLIFSLLSAIESLIRRGVIYHLSTMLMLNLGFLIIMGFAYQWRSVIATGLAKHIQGPIGERIEKLCNSHWGFFLAIPALLVLVVFFLARQLGNWSSHFEFTKRIAAEIFRFRLENAIDKDGKTELALLPSGYRQHFALTGIVNPDQLMTPALKGLDEICALLTTWAQGTNPVNSLAIVGHKGAGKTCLLAYLATQMPEVRILQAAVPSKLTGKQQVLDFFSNMLSVSDLDSLLSGPEIPTARPKTIVLLDEAHNLFLSIQGGFEGYHAFLELISQATTKLFWCCSFNYYAWTYLHSVNARHQYFDAVIRLAPWSEKSIQELILSMHTKTGFRLSYDDILQAAGSEMDREQVTYIENRFFSLLRQQSRGNPRLALYLWLSALSKVGVQELRVGLPDEPDVTRLSNLPEDALFVLAAIARHENLNFSQTVAVTQLPEGAVRHVLEMAVRLKLLYCDENKVYRLGILYQYPLINYLLAKHCLYE